MNRVPVLTTLGVLLAGAGSALVMYGYYKFAPQVSDTYVALRYNETMASEWPASVNDFIEENGSHLDPENHLFTVVHSALVAAGVTFALVLAILSTGISRENSCQGKSCCQKYAMFLHFTSGVVVMLLLVLCLIAALIIFAPMLLSLYLEDPCSANATKPCFNASDFGLSLNESSNDAQICFGDDDFCEKLEDIQTGFTLWFLGSIGCALGMVLLLMAHAANFAHFGDMRKTEDDAKYVHEW